MEDKERAPMFQRSPDTELLIRRLSKCEVGAHVPYAELCIVAHRKNTDELRSILLGAIKALQREGIFFETVRCVGIQRVSDNQIVGKGSQTRQRIARASRKTRNILARVDYDKLSDTERAQWNAHNTVLALHERVEAPALEKSILNASLEQAKQLDIGSVLKLMQGK